MNTEEFKTRYSTTVSPKSESGPKKTNKKKFDHKLPSLRNLAAKPIGPDYYKTTYMSLTPHENLKKS